MSSEDELNDFEEADLAKKKFDSFTFITRGLPMNSKHALYLARNTRGAAESSMRPSAPRDLKSTDTTRIPADRPLGPPPPDGLPTVPTVAPATVDVTKVSGYLW